MQRGGVYDQKHSLLNYNGEIYNGIDIAHLCINIA